MAHDHFQPELTLDPDQLKTMRRHLEQVDAAAFDANRQSLARTVGRVDIRSFQRLAASTAHARALWVSAALHATDKAHAPSDADIAALARLRTNYEELSQAYDALRRMVERGYVCFLDLA